MDNVSLLALFISGLIFVARAYGTNEAGDGRIKRDFSPRGHATGANVHVPTTWRKTAVANRLFAHKLYRNVARSRPEGNLLISPFVVSTGLTMVLLGARGTTEQELMHTLEYTDMGMKRRGQMYTKADVPRSYLSLLNKTQSSAMQGGHTFTVACKLFGEQTETFLPEFVRDTKKYYNAKFEAVDFAQNPEGARQQINEWVSTQTEGTIEEAVPPGSITSSTLLTLVSTAYFKGTWKNQFNPELTSPGVFHLRDGTEQMVDFMFGKFRLKHKYSSRFGDIVILPYKSLDKDFEIRMELLLPHNEQRLRQFETLDEEQMNRELRKFHPRLLRLYLPKFQIDCGIDLRTNLETLGLPSLFGAADLSGMNGRHNLNIGDANHRSFIQVNEEGTTAGSSLTLTTLRSSSTPELRFDRPFFFLIRETRTNSVLFIGRVDRPN